MISPIWARWKQIYGSSEGGPDLRAFPIGVGWRLATARAKSLPDWKRQIDPDQHPVALHPRPIQIARDTPYATHGAEPDAYK
jgi:hypothetical protein